MRRRASILAFALYLALSIVYFGWGVLLHPGRDYVGLGYDPQILIWAFAWWSHALMHGLNPLTTNAVWATHGENLSFVVTVPGLALAFAPVTLLAGPVVSYNLAAILLPALAAWTAFLLCRYLTHRTWPALFGGYLFGFSSYLVGQTEGHLHVSAVFLLPLAVLLVVRFVEGSLSGRELALRFGLLLGAQLLFSLEIFVTLTLALVVALLAAAALVAELRPRVRAAIGPLAAAYGIGVLLASPVLIDALVNLDTRKVNEPLSYSADLLNPFVPTALIALSTGWTRATSSLFVGNAAEEGAYLGLPLLLIVLWFAWSRRRSATARLLIVLIAVGVVAELGPRLHVRGHDYAPLPWRAVVGLPVFDNVLPDRLSIYVALGVAVAAALWASSSHPAAWIRATLAALAIVSLVPAFWHHEWHTHPNRAAFFTDGTYRRCLTPGENVLVLPYPSWTGSTLWQAEHGFYYRMASGALSPLLPRGIPDQATVLALLSNNTPSGGGKAIVAFARAQHATAILIDGAQSEPWLSLLSNLGYPVVSIDGVYLLNLSAKQSSCN